MLDVRPIDVEPIAVETTAVLDGLEAPAHVEIETTTHRRGGSLPLSLLLLVLAQAVVALDVDAPVLRPAIALVTFVALPTLVLHRRALRLPYAFGIAVLALIVGGLILDTVLPWVGVDRPLAPAPLALAWLVGDAALLAWRRQVPVLTRAEARAAGRWLLALRFELAPTLAAVALLLSVAGAIRLNNGASGVVAVTAVVVSGAALLALLASRQDRAPSYDGWVIGLVAAGLLLATSLRGWGITGHDVQAEYLAFQLTDQAQNWEMSALPSAYNACLSVTVLPTVLAQTTGLSGLVVFKLLLQLLFATVPVLTFLFARRVVPRRLAIAAAVLSVAFPTFFTDMPYLVRQEVAFFFLALVLLAATDGLRTRTARGLVVVLSVGVVLSHYSTTYVLLMALVAALLGLAVLALVRRVRHRDRPPVPPLVLLHPGVVAALVVATLAWAGPVTHTGGHASEVLHETVRSLTGQGSADPGSSDTSYFLFGDSTSPQQRMHMFVRATMDYRDAEIPRPLRVIPHPGPAELAPEVHTAPSTPVKVACAVVMEGFLLLGLVRLLRRRRLADEGDGAGDPLPRETGLLIWGSMAALGLIVLVPNLSVDYGVLRAFQQTMLVVAPVMAAGMWLVVRRRVLAAIVPVALLVVLAGTQQRIALGDSGSYYDRFYVTDSELAGLTWLGEVDHADRSNERLIANRNLNVRLLALSDNRAPVSDRLYPTLLSRDAYVFVDGQVLDQGESTVFYTGDLLTYRYPLREVDRRLDLVYDAPQARVYR